MSHILIIDDDIHINEMLEEVLIQEGYQVSHAYSGTEALLFLANEKPDLILRIAGKDCCAAQEKYKTGFFGKTDV